LLAYIQALTAIVLGDTMALLLAHASELPGESAFREISMQT
jgi:hypothetical protein